LEKDAALDEAKVRLASIVATLPDMLWMTDNEGRIRLCNSSLERFTGHSQDQLRGRKLPIAGLRLPSFMQDNDHAGIKASGPNVLEVNVRHPRTGANVFLEIHKVAVRNDAGDIQGVVGVARDITVRKNLELELTASKSELQKQAFSDPLTGLPNRRHYTSKIEDMLAAALASGTIGAMMMIDLDRFSAINDSVGHAAGDILLTEMAARARKIAVTVGGYVARLNGDEFIVFVPDIGERQNIGRIAEAFLTEIGKPFFSENRVLTISASIGIALIPEHSRSSSDLLIYADNAMFEAKRAGRNTWCIFDESLIFEARERFALEADIRRSMEANHFTSHYQAKIDLKTGEITGIEALMRWRHPERGNIPPAIFIPLAEETGLILPLGEKILTDACHFARIWNDGSRRPARIAVNLSPRQIMFDDFMPLLKSSLSKTGCRPEWLELEITENILLSDEQRVTELMQGLAALGVSIAIDDFGTGYSAMSYLTRYPINALKIDRSFVHQVTEDSKKAVLVKAIIAMASGLGMKSVAEGIETSHTAAYMRDIGCNEGQGFLWNRPMAQDDFMRWAADRAKVNAAE
jgi:diguanylate cyclase (GGDEF)-like protein/PAS domain S-box-containing protein